MDLNGAGAVVPVGHPPRPELCPQSESILQGLSSLWNHVKQGRQDLLNWEEQHARFLTAAQLAAILAGDDLLGDDAVGDAEIPASSAVNASQLANQLTRVEAESIFTADGDLQPEVIASSRQIIAGDELRNPALVKELTSEGGSISDWGKYATQTFHGPSGNFQVHFYYNSQTGVAFYGMDYKVVFLGSRT